MVGLEGCPERVGDPAFEASKRFFGSFPGLEFALVVVVCWLVVSQLGDRDAVQDGVELAVAAAVQAVAVDTAGAGFEGSDPLRSWRTSRRS